MSLSGILRRKGAAITFSKADRTTGFDSSTDTAPDPTTPATVAGRAMGIGGPEGDRPGTDVETAKVRLVFQPTTPGQLPARHATCDWAGETWAVDNVEPVAMDGDAIGAFVELAR